MKAEAHYSFFGALPKSEIESSQFDAVHKGLMIRGANGEGGIEGWVVGDENVFLTHFAELVEERQIRPQALLDLEIEIPDPSPRPQWTFWLTEAAIKDSKVAAALYKAFTSSQGKSLGEPELSICVPPEWKDEIDFDVHAEIALLVEFGEAEAFPILPNAQTVRFIPKKHE